MSNINEIKIPCCRCGVPKLLSKLSGYDYMLNDGSRAKCRRLVECDSPEARKTIRRVVSAVSCK